MPGTSRVIWHLLVPIIALLASSCGGSAPATSASPIVGGPSASVDDRIAPLSGTIDPRAITFDLSKGPLAALAAEEDAARAHGRSLAGLADYLGPDALAFATALDQQASDELWKLVDAATATASRGLASIGRPGAAELKSAAALPPPGVSFVGPWLATLMIVDTTNGSAYSNAAHAEDEVTVGSNTGKITTDIKASVTPSGSRIIVDVDLKIVGEVTDANGQLIFRINGAGHGHVEIQACPDAQGTAQATLEFSSNEDHFLASAGGRSGHSWKQDVKADARIFADNEANLDHETVDYQADTAVKGGTRAAGAGQSDLTDYTVNATGTMTLGKTENGTSGGRFNAHNVTAAQVDETFKTATLVAGLATSSAAKAAEKFWRSGKCIDVVVDPNGGDVAANATTTVTVRVRHKFDGGELDKPVEATMTGVKSISPAGQKLPAPASFTFTAGPKLGDTAEVTFKSVSNRGIGQTTVIFIVGGGWNADHQMGEQSIKGQKCGGLDGVWRVDGLIESAQVKSTSTWIATIDGTTLLGTYTYKSVTRSGSSAGDFVTTDTGTGRATIVVATDGTLVMTLAGTKVTSTAVGAGTSVTITLPIPDLPFSWVPGGVCPP